MLQNYFVGVVSGVSFVVLVFASSFAVMPERPAIQPIEFSHQQHVTYFRSGDHRREHIKFHEKLLSGEIPDELVKGRCTECHDDFEQAVEDTPKIEACAGCHEILLQTDIRSRPDILVCVCCHRGALTERAATIPGRKICAACHTEPQTESDEERKLREYFNAADEVPWVRVFDYLPGDIVFSHERHVMLGMVDCQKCHGRIENVSGPLKRLVELSMEACMHCHDVANADNDCLVCHK